MDGERFHNLSTSILYLEINFHIQMKLHAWNTTFIHFSSGKFLSLLNFVLLSNFPLSLMFSLSVSLNIC